jgi:hypothetical protein
MAGVLGAAWRGLADTGTWDFSPLGWAVVLLLAARATGIRIRWWGILVAVAGGLPCATISEALGPVSVVVAVFVLSLVLRPVVRAGQRA